MEEIIETPIVNIKIGIPDNDTVGKIFYNKNNAIDFIINEHLASLDLKTLSKLTAKKVYGIISENWDYEKALRYTREKFLKSDKAIRGKNGYNNMRAKIDEWKEHHDLSELDWPFGAGQSGFDDSVMDIIRTYENDNSKIIPEAQKDIEKHFYMKEISTFRNDYIEYLIVNRYEFVMPTLGDKKDADFFFDGVMYDQKISRSVGKIYKEKYGKSWKETALERPETVAKSLYEHQGSARFGANARFLIVFVNNEFNEKELIEKLDNFDFSKPYKIEFKYKKNGPTFKTNCLCLII